MNVIEVEIKNKKAVRTNDTAYICDNSDFTVVFSFDEEWNEFDVKTARFAYDDKYQDVVFTGTKCAMPIISNTKLISVGVFAGTLRTTTPAQIVAYKSILGVSGTPEPPADDVYSRILQMIDDGMIKGEKGEKGEKGDVGPKGDVPIKGVDYFTETEQSELVDNVFNVLKEMNAFDIVSFISDTKVTLNHGRIYFFESAGDTYKVQLYDQDGNVQSQIDETMGGIILYPSSGLAKYISIKEKPSSINLSDLLNFNGLFDKFIESTTFNVNTEKPNIYLETVDNHNFRCWEITGNSCDLQIGTYAMKELIEGITAELSVSFIYPLEFDEYAVAIDGVEIERQSYGGTMRIAAELLKSKNTQIVFYRNGEEVIKARVHPTILNCGMLYAIER